MNTKFSTKAHHLVRAFASHTRKQHGQPSDGLIHSLNTEHQYVHSITRLLEWMDDLGMDINGPYPTEVKQEFLYSMEEVWLQTQLDTARQAFELVFGEKLLRVRSSRPTLLTTRSYTHGEVFEILKHQTDWNAMATVLGFQAGLRAHEHFTLKRADEAVPSPGRNWSPHLFYGLEKHLIYIVTGKGGLSRKVAIPRNSAEALEARRLVEPRQIVDRGIYYQSYYAIGGGQAFSQSFSVASKKVFGFSTGAHGLRHSFAKTRLAQLKSYGCFTLDTCMKIVSQELGHFRPGITLTYLR